MIYHSLGQLMNARISGVLCVFLSWVISLMYKPEQCFGCLDYFQSTAEHSISHPYVGAIPACWHVYTNLLAQEFTNPDFFKIHRITVDAYLAQHIGDQQDRRARQSSNLHIISLYLYFEKKLSTNMVLNFLKKATENKHDWPAIFQLREANWKTILDILETKNASDHIKQITEWGRSVWDAYTDQHPTIITTYEKFILK